ncbi:ABC transporter permease [Nafulsella turpanensis]|uniref:ABC transporter permease n=1 Tax=Nafulsella turpanensis TaxID=1265690 RepID=UPI000347B2B3|nr:FtsX-like permease family protein [Nafulsella turpanensis]
MNILQLSIRSLKARPAATTVSLLLLTLGVAIISLLFMLNQQLEEKFQKNISGIDMVVGAKGSPLQLILSAVFQIDYPTGNIKLEEARGLQRNRYIERAIPLAYGDSYQGYRLVGTDSSYLSLYEAELAGGRRWAAPYEVVLGSKVAEATGLEVGDSFFSAHGMVAGAAAHDTHPYTVVGVLERSNAVPDGLILTSVESIWAIHAHEEGGEADSAAKEERELTAMLIKFRSPMGMVMLPRQINERTNMQAAIPAMEINRLFSLLGIGIELLQAIAFSIILIAGLSFFLSLYSSLRERKYELALMRSMGASRTKIVGLVVLEGILLSLAGYILGLLLGHGGLALLSSLSEGAYGYGFDFVGLTQDELLLGLAVLVIGLMAAFVPAIKAMRTPISETLAQS